MYSRQHGYLVSSEEDWGMILLLKSLAGAFELLPGTLIIVRIIFPQVTPPAKPLTCPLPHTDTTTIILGAATVVLICQSGRHPSQLRLFRVFVWWWPIFGQSCPRAPCPAPRSFNTIAPHHSKKVICLFFLPQQVPTIT